MQDYRHTHRTTPEDSHSLQQQRQAPTTMNTTISSTLLDTDPRETRRRGIGLDLGGDFEQESGPREDRPQPAYRGDRGLASGETDMSLPVAGGMPGWKMAFGSSGESATSGVGDGPEGTSGEIGRGTSGSGSGTHKSAPEHWFNAFNRDVGGNNYTTFDGTDPNPNFFYSPKKKHVLARLKCTDRL